MTTSDKVEQVLKGKKHTGFEDKTLWDWIQIFIQLLTALALPIALFLATQWFSTQQSQASDLASERQHQTDTQIATDQQQEAALQAYLGQMSDLLLIDNLRKSRPGDEVRQVARARTLTVLRRLDSARKGYLLLFIYEANLINKNDVIVQLSDADLRNAAMRFVNLSDADLSGANLSGANLSGANLSGANFYHADLSGANLSGAILSEANLTLAILSKADLTLANLSGASLSGANLKGANLCQARGATQEQLQSALTLTGATMPDCTNTKS